MNQKPSVGRIVHYYVDDDKVPLAAIITFVSDVKQSSIEDSDEDGVPLVNLGVWGESGVPGFRQGVEFRVSPTAGCWSWPPRAP